MSIQIYLDELKQEMQSNSFNHLGYSPLFDLLSKVKTGDSVDCLSLRQQNLLKNTIDHQRATDFFKRLHAMTPVSLQLTEQHNLTLHQQSIQMSKKRVSPKKQSTGFRCKLCGGLKHWKAAKCSGNCRVQTSNTFKCSTCGGKKTWKAAKCYGNCPKWSVCEI